MLLRCFDCFGVRELRFYSVSESWEEEEHSVDGDNSSREVVPNVF